jgi:hypothetical protein
MRWAVMKREWGEKIAYRLLVGKREGKRPLGIPRRRWVYNINIDPVEIDGVVWTGWVWLRRGTGGELL